MGLFYFPGYGYAETSTFGPRNGSYHYGIDFAAPLGTDIPAAAEGVVWRTGKSESAGYFVILKHTADGKDFYTVYEHMKGENIPPVDTKVDGGQKIGEVGNTGKVEGTGTKATGRLQTQARETR